tara:strand:- start:18484 stop:19104 length:621 start_codon:yes stop_codon:yes gene_type:complete
MEKGTVVMPTMTWRTVTPQQPVFDIVKTPSHVGILSEVFRTEFASHRSWHPTHSVAAIGSCAQELTSSHHLSHSPCSNQSPYGLIRNSSLLEDCYIMFIDVGLESCTFIHHYEEAYAPEIYLSNDIENYDIHSDGEYLSTTHTFRHRPLAKNFHHFINEMTAGTDYMTSSIGDALILLMKADSLNKHLCQKFSESKYASFSPYSYL